MLLKKKLYKNYIVLENGAIIRKFSFKFWKILELEKDNYNPNYIQTLKQKQVIDLSNQSKTFHFLHKYKN